MLSTLPDGPLLIVLSFLEIPALQDVAKTCKRLAIVAGQLALTERKIIRQKKQDFIKSIISWIRQHPDNVTVSSNHSDHSLITWFHDEGYEGKKFNPYPSKMEDFGRRRNECDYYFRKGSMCGNNCSNLHLPGKKRCAWHDHPIFDRDMLPRLGRYLDEMYQQYIC